MPDGNEDVSRGAPGTASLSSWRERCLAALRKYVVSRDKADRAALLAVARVYRRIRLTGSVHLHPDDERGTAAFEKKLNRLMLMSNREWTLFFLADIGIDDAAAREEFKPISPFKECLLLLLRYDGFASMRGDVGAFLKTMSRQAHYDLAVVHQQWFPPSGDRQGKYVFLALRVKKLGS